MLKFIDSLNFKYYSKCIKLLVFVLISGATELTFAYEFLENESDSILFRAIITGISQSDGEPELGIVVGESVTGRILLAADPGDDNGCAFGEVRTMKWLSYESQIEINTPFVAAFSGLNLKIEEPSGQITINYSPDACLHALNNTTSCGVTGSVQPALGLATTVQRNIPRFAAILVQGSENTSFDYSGLKSRLSNLSEEDSTKLILTVNADNTASTLTRISLNIIETRKQQTLE